LDTVKWIIISIAGLSGAVVLLLTAIRTIRDTWVEHGWPKEGSRIYSSWERAQRNRISPILAEMGWQGGHARAIRDANERIRIEALPSPATPAELPRQLFALLKPMTCELEEGRYYGEKNKYYVDTMGAIHYPKYRDEIVWLTVKWLKVLIDNGELQPFDCVLSNKQGNPTLVSDVCRVWSLHSTISPIVCKPELDSARVKPGGCVPHQTDFEGLRAFLEERAEDIEKGMKLRAIALDDQCAGGTAIRNMMRGFNKLIGTQRLPFQEVHEAVVLFVINDEKTTTNFVGNLKLHSLLHLDETRKKTILSGGAYDPKTFISGNACRAIRELIGGA